MGLALGHQLSHKIEFPTLKKVYNTCPNKAYPLRIDKPEVTPTWNCLLEENVIDHFLAAKGTLDPLKCVGVSDGLVRLFAIINVTGRIPTHRLSLVQEERRTSGRISSEKQLLL